MPATLSARLLCSRCCCKVLRYVDPARRRLGHFIGLIVADPPLLQNAQPEGLRPAAMAPHPLQVHIWPLADGLGQQFPAREFEGTCSRGRLPLEPPQPAEHVVDRLAIGDHGAAWSATVEAPGRSRALGSRDGLAGSQPTCLGAPFASNLAADAKADNPGCRVLGATARAIDEDNWGPPSRLNPHGCVQLGSPLHQSREPSRGSEPALTALQEAELVRDLAPDSRRNCFPISPGFLY